MIAFRHPHPPTFALIGAAGYIAPKHGAAIKAVGGRLVAAYDDNDAVGWLDKDWPECRFTDSAYTLPDTDYCVICSPNFLHLDHAFLGVSFANTICEKPLTLTTADLDELAEVERGSGHRVYTIMNLRHHPEMIRAKQQACEARPARVAVTYHAPRGPWYDVSWKGDPARSGGIAFNIGIHIYDALVWMFGRGTVTDVDAPDPRSLITWTKHPHALYGETLCRVFLSTRADAKPRREIVFTYEDRPSVTFDLGRSFSLGEGGLHGACYREILAGRGPGIEDARPGIELCEAITGSL